MRTETLTFLLILGVLPQMQDPRLPVQIRMNWCRNRSDNIGGLWFGKLRVGNYGFLSTGNITFEQEAMMGVWYGLILMEDGDFSKTGLNGSELVVDKGNHGQRNRLGTSVFLVVNLLFLCVRVCLLIRVFLWVLTVFQFHGMPLLKMN